MDLKKFRRENYVERRGTGTLKQDSLQEIFGDAGLSPLQVADMKIRLSAVVHEAPTKRVEHGVLGYSKAEDSHYDAFFAWQKKYHGVGSAKENIRLATGMVGPLYAAIRVHIKENASITICPPVYCLFYGVIPNTERKLVTCDLDSNKGHYSLNLDKLEREIPDSNAETFILCSLYNPVCRIWSEEELNAMLDTCHRHRVLVVPNEIHQDLTHGEIPFIPSATVKGGEYRDMLIILNSGPKTFNLAGLIHSHVTIYDRKLMETYDAYIKNIGSPEVNLLGVTGMKAAFRNGEEWLGNVKPLICHNYDYMKLELAKEFPDVVVTPLEGTYLSWLDLRNYVPEKETASFVQDECRPACDAGEWFSFMGHGFIRINLTTGTKNTRTAVGGIVTNIRVL